MCTWAVGDYCLKHRDRDLTPCRDFRGIGAKPKEKTGYIEYLDDTIPEPRKAEDEEERQKMNEKEITIQGKTYPSIKAAASAYGLTSSAIIARRKADWTDEDYERGHRNTTPSGAIPTTINGIEYPSRAEAARAYQISPMGLRHRLDAGWTDEDFRRGGRGRK